MSCPFQYPKRKKIGKTMDLYVHTILEDTLWYLKAIAVLIALIFSLNLDFLAKFYKYSKFPIAK